MFEPANSHFWEIVGSVEPGLFKAFNPGGEITTPAALAGLLAGAGVPHPEALAVPAEHRLEHPDSFWDIVLGSGYRATIDALGPAQRENVRARLIAALRSDGVRAVRTDVVFATARRPG